MPQKDFKENILAEPTAVYGYNNQKHDPYFIDPLGDFGFKRLFGAEQNKALTIAFLNHVLQGKREITSLEFLKNEYPGDTREEGGAVIDMVCKARTGHIFLLKCKGTGRQILRSGLYSMLPDSLQSRPLGATARNGLMHLKMCM